MKISVVYSECDKNNSDVPDVYTEIITGYLEL